MSHGQASVEHGFSVNKHVEIANLNEDNFVVKRLICDHVTSMGGLKNIYTSNKALLNICLGKVLKKCLNL